MREIITLQCPECKEHDLDDEEQENDHWPFGVLEVLQAAAASTRQHKETK